MEDTKKKPDACYTCEKELVKNHTSWLCSEECREKYWEGIKPKKQFYTKEELFEKLGELKEYRINHPLTYDGT